MSHPLGRSRFPSPFSAGNSAEPQSVGHKLALIRRLTCVYVVIYNCHMHGSLSLAASIIPWAIDNGRRYGFDTMEAAGLPGGAIYPSLRRLETAKLTRSAHEQGEQSKGPSRKHFPITPRRKRALSEVIARYPVLAEGSAPV